MQLTYTVNNIYRTLRNRTGSVDGAPQGVLVPEIEVELYDPTGKHGSVQFHFNTPDEVSYAMGAFEMGKTVSITLPDAPVAVAEPVVSSASVEPEAVPVEAPLA